MLERLLARAEARAEAARRRVVEKLADRPAPSGVQVEASEAGIVLLGRRLRMRLIRDAVLRSWWR